MTRKEPKITEAIKKTLADLQVENDMADCLRRTINALIHRLVLSLNYCRPKELAASENALAGLVQLHDIIGVLADMPDDIERLPDF